MEDLLVLSGIKKEYPGKKVLKGVNLTIKAGTVHGFLGPNGAGKSTLMNIMLGILENEEGSLQKREDLKIGYLPENPPLYVEMKVRAYLKFVQEIYGDQDDSYIDEVISLCGLKEVEKIKIEHLSKGFKQRVGIAQAICHRPDLLVLDEPMVGLDPHAVEKMKELIKNISSKHTVFLSSHQLHELSQICTHISILHKGVIVKDGKLDEVEREINKGQVVEVEFSLDVKDIVFELTDKYKIEITSVGKNRYRFKSNEKEDLRILISDFFLEKKISILEMNKVKIDLEEIFKIATEISQ